MTRVGLPRTARHPLVRTFPALIPPAAKTFFIGELSSFTILALESTST